MSGYMIFWSQDHVKKLKKAGDNGPIQVVYGGRHSKEPSLKKIKVGDVIFPVALEKDQLVVMARLQVEKLENAFEYQLREVGMPCQAIIPEGTMLISDGPFTETDGRFIMEYRIGKEPLRHMYRKGVTTIIGNLYQDKKDWTDFVGEQKSKIGFSDLEYILNYIAKTDIYNKYVECTLYDIPVGINKERVIVWGY